MTDPMGSRNPLLGLILLSVLHVLYAFDQGESKSEIQPSAPMVVVGTIDGTAYVLDAVEGALLRSFDTGGPTVSSFRASREAPLLIASANAEDARLFMVNAPSKEAPPQVQQLNSTLRDLVRSTPFRDMGGHLYVGSEISQLFAFDLASSTLQRFNERSVESVIQSDPTESMKPRNLARGNIFLGRTEYVARAFDKHAGEERFNISAGEFSSAFRSLDSHVDLNHADIGASSTRFSVCPPLRYVATSDGTLYAFEHSSGNQIWKAAFPTTVVAVFTFVNGAVHPCEKNLNE